MTIGIPEKAAAGITTGLTMAWLGHWFGFVLLGAIGGIVGHIIWAERNPEEAQALPFRGHCWKLLGNMIVSAFLGFSIYLLVLDMGFERRPAAYFVTAILGMFSIDSALFVFDFVKQLFVDAARRIVSKVDTSGKPPEVPLKKPPYSNDNEGDKS